MNDRRRIRRALISVSDKSGIAEFARALEALGVEILSTGGTARLLASEGITVVEVSEYTGHAEIMAGRLKTLHPKIHGGLLGRRGIDDDTMDHHGIAPIDLVVVNLYPFRETIAQDDCDLATAVEHIDIGGPTMLRAAAKNYSDVTVVVDVNDYATILAELAHSEGRVAARTRFFLAGKAFEHTAAYDGAIAEYLGGFDADGERRAFAATHNRQFRKAQDMRYGENPHQAAAFYVEDRAPEPCVASARQQQGKALSYNNIADTDAALECVKQFEQPACVIVKHANPCGAATAATPLLAYERSFDCDPTSAFGGVIALNRPLDDATADAILGRQFVEVIIAPGASAEALSVAGRKRNIRVLTCDPWGVERNPGMDYKRVNGGLLVQERDAFTVTSSDLQIVTERAPDEREFADLHFAWLIAKFVKSNAIVYARDRQTIGIGAGQMSRVYSARIAAIKATDEGIELGGAVMASDAFFPFRDGIDAAAECGITAVIQPGGSVRDGDVIVAANEHGMAMIHTGMRHFRH